MEGTQGERTQVDGTQVDGTQVEGTWTQTTFSSLSLGHQGEGPGQTRTRHGDQAPASWLVSSPQRPTNVQSRDVLQGIQMIGGEAGSTVENPWWNKDSPEERQPVKHPRWSRDTQEGLKLATEEPVVEQGDPRGTEVHGDPTAEQQHPRGAEAPGETAPWKD